MAEPQNTDPSVYIFGAGISRRIIEYTVREFAQRERVTVRTVKTWLSKGAVESRRTPGGGVRIIDRRETW